MNRIALPALVMLLGGCEATTAFYPGPQRFPQQAAGCRVEYFALPPDGYQEIGRLEFVPNGAGLPCTEQAMRTLSNPTICRAGGNAFFAIPNGQGCYINGAVLRRTPSSTPPAPSTPTIPATSTSGCQYDTQCKGDRVCTAGACVDPTPR